MGVGRGRREVSGYTLTLVHSDICLGFDNSLPLLLSSCPALRTCAPEHGPVCSLAVLGVLWKPWEFGAV